MSGLRFSVAFARWLGLAPDATRSVAVQRVSSTATSPVNAGRRRRAMSGDLGVYRGGLFRKTVIRDMMASAVAVPPRGPERNAAKRARRALRGAR